MASGKIKKWFSDRGFGFIQPDDGGDDVFLHVKAFPEGSPEPKEGDGLTYDLANDPRSGRLRASNVNRR